MAKLKYYALCCRGMPATKRHLTRIPKADLVIVINSQNSDYVTEATNWCVSESIEHYVTASDGTPSTGKNSVFDLFIASNNDYMVLVDGDDFITPHGLYIYDTIAQSASPPDAVALEFQFGLVPNNNYNTHLLHVDESSNASVRDARDKLNQDHIHGWGLRIFQKPYEWWAAALDGTSVPHHDEFTEQCSNMHRRLMTHEHEYINGWESHLRIVFYSKAGAAFRFDPELLVGEDTMQYFRLKNAMVDGDIDLRHLNEIYPTYVYDQRIEGIVGWANERDSGRGWLVWMTALVNEFDRYLDEGKMHTTVPPAVILPEPADDYRPDTLGLVNYPHRLPKY